MKKLILLLILGTFLISCNKKYHMVGRVFNPITGEGIANAKVKFSRTTFEELPGGDEEVANTLTDSNGNYDLEFKGRAEVVKLEVDASLYELGTLKEGVYQQALQLEAKKTMEVNWHAVPYGSLILNIQNVNCEGSTDTMVFRAKGQFDLDYTSWSALKRIGCYTYTSPPPYATFPMGYRYYEMKVTRPSGVTFIYDTVFIPETGVAQVDLFY